MMFRSGSLGPRIFCLLLAAAAGALLVGGATAFASGSVAGSIVAKAERHTSLLAGQWQIVGEGKRGLEILTTNRQRPRLLPMTACAFNPVWSPDGSAIAFTCESKQAEEIFIVQASGGAPRRLVRLPKYSSSFLARGPDGRHLAFVFQNSELDVIGSDGSGRNRIRSSRPRGYLGEFSWSPDSHKIVYLDGGGLHSADLDAQKERLLARGTLGAPMWSPNGHLIAYPSNCVNPGAADIDCDVSVMNADGGGKHRLFKTGLLHTGPDHVVWSQDSQTIFFNVGGRGRSPGLAILNVQTGAFRKVARWADEVVVGRDGTTVGILTDSWRTLVIATPAGRILRVIRLPQGFDASDLRVG